MDDWDIQSSVFDKEFVLVSYPDGKTTPSLTIENINYTDCVVKNKKMFEILG